MDQNCLEISKLVIDVIARIFVPMFVPVIVFLLGRKPVKKLIDTRLLNIEKELREHIRGYSDEEQQLIEKTLNKVFSDPSMRW